MLLLTGCQSYEARPLDLAAQREAWHERSLESASMTEFVARLDQVPGETVADFNPGDGLSLTEGQLVALVFNPDLRLARLRAGRAAASSEYAGLWADPQLAASALRATNGVAKPWDISPGLNFNIPLSDRLQVERDLSDAQLRSAQRATIEEEWRVWCGVRTAWTTWSAALLLAEENERFIKTMDDLVQTTSDLAASGEIDRTEASLFGIEQAQRRNELRRQRGEADAAKLELLAWLGLAPDSAVELQPSMDSVEVEMESEQALDELTSRNPALQQLREEYNVAEQSLRLEISEQYPDLTLGPLLEFDQGQTSIGLAGAILLPIFDRNRQAIAEARASRELARATYETEYERLAGQWAATSARARSLAEQRADIKAVLVPLVDRQLDDALRLMRLGEGTTSVLLESLTRAHQTKFDLINAHWAEAIARTELVSLIGPPTTAPSKTTP